MTQSSELPAGSTRKRGLGRWLLSLVGNIELWIVLSLLFILLVRMTAPDAEDASSLWFLDPLLSLIFLLLLWLNRWFQFRKRKLLSAPQAALGFVLISWTGSMLYEATISQSSGQYGGMHAKTIPSFIIAQGFYIPLAIGGLWLVRRYHISPYELFFVAGMTSIYEATTVGIPAMLSPMFLFSPLVIAYYFVVYSRFLSMSLLFIDEELLWDKSPRRITFGKKLFYGTLLGVCCWVIFVAWGEAMNYYFDDFKSFA